MSIEIRVGDCRDLLGDIADGSIHCCVTSPPYYGLRDYGVAGQIGLEPGPEEFISSIVRVFREVRRVLREDGTMWLNIGDSYAGSWGARGRGAGTNSPRPDWESKHGTEAPNRHGFPSLGVKPKDLIGIPWRIAFALQADGWYLRQDIIWHKPNPLPESVKDRCTKAHEYVFLLSKSPRYYYDVDALREDRLSDEDANDFRGGAYTGHEIDNAVMGKRTSRGNRKIRGVPPRYAGLYHSDRSGLDSVSRGLGRNKRSVWTIATQPFKDAHFATFPPDLVEPCILAGCPRGGTVLDPFGGAGTTALVASRNERNALLIELNPAYAAMAKARLESDAGLFADVEVA